MRTKLFCGLVIVISILLTINSANANTASDLLIADGKETMWHDGDVVLSFDYFDQAVGADPHDLKARFWRAFSRIFSNTMLISYMQSLNVINAQYESLIFDNDGDIVYDFDRGYPTATEFQNLAVNLISTIDLALADLSFFTGSPVIIKQETILGSDYAWGINDSNGWVKHATRFSVTESYSTKKIDVRLIRTGNPSGNLTLTLCGSAVGNNYPDESNAIASTTLECSTIPVSFDWVSFSFDTPVNLTAGNYYWIVLQSGYPASSTNKVSASAAVQTPYNWTFHNGTAWQNMSTYTMHGYYRIYEYGGATSPENFSDTMETVYEDDMIDLDLGDAKALATFIHLIKSALNFSAAYNLNNADIYQIFFSEDFDLLTYLNSYPQAFTQMPDCAGRLSQSKISFINFINSYIEASAFIRTQRLDNDGLNHMTSFYQPYDANEYASYTEWQSEKEDILNTEELIREKLTDILNNLTDTSTYPSVRMPDVDYYDADNHQVDFNAFFTPINFRTLINEIDLDREFVYDNFSDATIGEIFPNATTADINALLGNGVAFDRQIIIRDNDTVSIQIFWDRIDSEYNGSFVYYKLYRSTSPDVYDNSTLVATITNPDTTDFTDTSIGSSDIYFYRLYTYYNFGAGNTAKAYATKLPAVIKIYVDAGNHADTEQDGSMAHPFSDLGDTISEKVTEGTKVLAAQGTYNESTDTMYFCDRVILEGGYNSLDWSRDFHTYETVIDGSGLEKDTIPVSETSYVVIDGVSVTGATSGPWNASGISLWNSDNTIIKNCKIYGNTIGISNGYSSSALINNLIVNNEFIGIILHGENSESIVMNNTISNNGGYGIDYRGMQQIIIKNNIITNNTALWGGIGICASYTQGYLTPSIVSYNNVYGHSNNCDYRDCGTNAGSDNNISVNPLFLDSPVDFHLSYNSPCVDTGDNNIYELVNNDLDGNSRLSGIYIDMGAYELPIEDSDNDNLPNWWEAENGLNMSVNDSNDDTDNDRLTNIMEYLLKTHPNMADSDTDGYTDDFEIDSGTDPNDPQSYFAVYEIGFEYNVLSLKWHYVDNKEYNIYWSDTPENPDSWDIVDESAKSPVWEIDETNKIITWYDLGIDPEMNDEAPSNTTTRYYKIKVISTY